MERLAGVASPLPVRPSKGVHIVVPRDTHRLPSWPSSSRTEKSVLFVLPWGSHWIIGTTDTPWEFGLDHPSASRADVDYLLGTSTRCCADRSPATTSSPCTSGCGRWWPRARRDRRRLARARGAAEQPGLVSIAGGKYTTYRIMARDAVDVAARDLPFSVPPSRTDGPAPARRDRLRPGRPAGEAASGRRRLTPRQVDHLARRYGTLALRVLDLAVEDPGLREPLGGAETYLAAEVLLRGDERGGAARGRRAHAPHPHRLRAGRPGTQGGRGRRADHGGLARLGRSDGAPRGGALPLAAGCRDGRAGHAGRRGGRRGARAGARRAAGARARRRCRRSCRSAGTPGP